MVELTADQMDGNSACFSSSDNLIDPRLFAKLFG